jgi:hypothetical protein
MDKVVLGQVSTKHFDLPCQFTFHQILHTQLTFVVGITGQLVANASNELQPHLKTEKKTKLTV